MTKYKLLIFDLDDTLFDYQKTERLALKKSLYSLSVPYSDELYDLYKKANIYAKDSIDDYMTNLAAFRRCRADAFFELIGKTNIDVDHFVALMLENSVKGVLINGVYETLSCIDIKKVIGTNGSTYPRLNKLENSEISSFFSGFYSSESLGYAKPDPRFFTQICFDEGVSLNETAVIGDKYHIDGIGAQKAGIDSYIISSNYADIVDVMEPPIRIIKTIHELLSYIDNTRG